MSSNASCLGSSDGSISLSSCAVADGLLEQAEPVLRELDGAIAHGAGARVHLGRDRGEEAAAGEDVVLDVPEEILG